MVTRSSQGAQQYNQELPGVRMSQAGGAAQIKRTEIVGDGGDQYRDRLIEGILGAGQKLATQGFETSLEEAYMAGQAKAAQLETEDQLEGNPLTKDWAVAGYRDSMAKIRLAESETKLKQDMQWLREQGPEKMNEYLAERRAKLSDAFGGMSREARAGLIGQIVLNDRAASGMHTAEHVKWQGEVFTTAAQKEWQNLAQDLNTAQRTQGPLGVDLTRQAVQKAAGFLARTLTDSRGTPELREQLVVEAVQDALASNNTALIAFMRGTSHGIGEADQTSRGVFGRLSIEAQKKLSVAEREAMGRTEDERNQQRMLDEDGIRKGLDDGTLRMSYDEISRWGIENLRTKYWKSNSQYISFMEHVRNKLATRDAMIGMKAAYTSGDTGFGARHGKSESEMMQMTHEQLSKEGVSLADQIPVFLQAGANSHLTGYKKVGEIMERAVWSIGNPENIPEPRKQEMQRIWQVYAGLEGGKHGPVGKAILSGMSSPEMQARFLAIGAALEKGEDASKAIAKRVEVETRWNAMSPSTRNAISEKNNREAVDLIRERTSEGADFLDRVFSLFSGKKANQTSILPTVDVASSIVPFWDTLPPKVMRQQLNNASTAVEAELSDVYLADPTIAPQDAVHIAEANVAKRAMKIPDGTVVILPNKRTPQNFFGDLTGYSSEAIAEAVAEVVKPQTDGGMITYTARGNFLTYQEVNKDGEEANRAGVIRKADVQTVLDRKDRERSKRNAALYGNAATYTDPTSRVSVRYGGENGAGVSNSVALDFRANVLVQEGARDTYYTVKRKDPVTGAVKESAKVGGVGIKFGPWQPKPGPDGKISPADIEASFVVATEDALTRGKQLADKFAGGREEIIPLYAEMVYQAGPLLNEKNGKAAQYLPVLQARTAPEAIEAFKRTGVWADSGEKRRNHYINMFNKFYPKR